MEENKYNVLFGHSLKEVIQLMNQRKINKDNLITILNHDGEFFAVYYE